MSSDMINYGRSDGATVPAPSAKLQVAVAHWLVGRADADGQVRAGTTVRQVGGRYASCGQVRQVARAGAGELPTGGGGGGGYSGERSGWSRGPHGVGDDEKPTSRLHHCCRY